MRNRVSNKTYYSKDLNQKIISRGPHILGKI